MRTCKTVVFHTEGEENSLYCRPPQSHVQ